MGLHWRQEALLGCCVVSIWLDNPDQWDKLAQAIEKAGECGFDTETYNQPDKTSPQHRARVHCFSVGLLAGNKNPRGYRTAVGRVLPYAAMDCPSLRRVFESPLIRKWAHNSPHDEHSTQNMGVAIKGLQDSLQWLRVACPGRIGYGLKEAEGWALGLPPRPSFLEVVTHTHTVTKATGRTERGCICGKRPCHARGTSDWLADDERGWLPHTRVTWRKFTPTKREMEARWDVTEFQPGHERWETWLEYSLADATRGIMLVDWLRGLKPAKVSYPWI